MDDIQMAQVEAGEQAVVERLRQKGLLPSESAETDCYCVCHSPWSSRPVCEHCNGNNEAVRRYREKQRQQLESTLARTFVRWMRLTNPAERQGLWLELFRLGRELEKLSDESNKM